MVEQSFEELYDFKGKDAILKLQEAHERKGFTILHEIQLPGVKKAIIEFSTSGYWFALYIKKTNMLNIYDSRNIEDCFQKITEGEPELKMKIDDEVIIKA